MTAKHAPTCPGGTCDDPATTFLCDVCGNECAACCGVSESETCDDCEGKMPVEEPKFPRIYVSLWSPTEIDWSDDEVETAVCFKRECDAITESCNGFVLYMPFDDYLSEANDLRAQLAETTGKLARLQKLWDLKCAELSIANKSINELRKADTVRPVTQSEHEKERCAFWDACCAAPYSNPCDGQWDNPQPKDEASMCAEVADAKLAERDKRFPAPESEEK